MKHPHSSIFRRAAQRGFTLIELMVSMAIGLIIMVALIAVFANVTRTNTEMAKTNGVIEGGRFAMDLFQEDVEHAGYWAGYIPPWDDISYNKQTLCSATAIAGVVVTDTLAGAVSGASAKVTAVGANYVVLGSISGTFLPTESITKSSVEVFVANGVSLDPTPCAGFTVPDPCLSYSTANWTNTYTYALVSLPVQAYRYQSTPAVCAGVIANQQPNTDVLIVRHADNCAPGSGNCEAANASKLYFQPTFCASEIQSATPSFVIGQTGFTLTQKDCTTVAERRKFVSNIYYVRNYAVSSGDGIPTLVRSTFNLNSGTPAHEDAVALIEGIESFVVDLGVDSQARCAGTAVAYSNLPLRWNPTTCAVDVTTTNNTQPSNRGDGVPETYVRCGTTGCTLAQLRDVVAVKVYVLARSREAGTGEVDSKTYTLGSVSGNTVTVTPGDKYRRHLFQSTIRLNNVSGRRESP